MRTMAETRTLTPAADLVKELALQGRSCAEAMLAAHGPALGLDEQTAVKLASGLGGGMGLMGGVCGALTAAYLVLGLRYGVSDPADKYGRQNVYLLVQECAERFRRAMGSTHCRDLCLAAHAGDKAWMAKARESGQALHVIENAAGILDDLLAERG